jgi:hypothetical protein
MQRALRPAGTAGIALLAAGFVTVPAAPPTPGGQIRAMELVSGEGVAFIIGGSGDPIPDTDYVDTNDSLYIQPHFPGYDSEALFTPEGNYALYTGVKSLTLDESEAQGVTILKDAIEKQVGQDNSVAVFGDSQSSTISSMTMTELADDHVPNSDVGFVLTGDPNLPDGGLFERLDGLSIPSLGITFNGATPDDLYPTTIYTQEYDGFADVPRYPIDLLSDLNSIAGIQYVHPTYQDLSATELSPTDEGGSAIELPTDGDTMTTYYMLPTDDLPLLDPLPAIPGVGTALADLLQPVLKPLVNLGYGDTDFGWSQGPANVPTEFGLFPDADMVFKAFDEMAEGIPKGIQAALQDVGTSDLSMSDLSSMLAPDSAEATSAADPVSGFTNVVNTLTDVVSTAYAALLPTADVITGVTVTIPAYDASLFLDGIKDGDLLSAVAQPLASDNYLFSLAAGFELFSLINTVETITADLSDLDVF